MITIEEFKEKLTDLFDVQHEAIKEYLSKLKILLDQAEESNLDDTLIKAIFTIETMKQEKRLDELE